MTQQAAAELRAQTVDMLMQYETAAEMHAQVERIARATGYVGEYELRMSDDLAEELVLEALGDEL